MAWYEDDSWATFAFAPHPLTIIVAILIAVLLPILVHSILYRSVSPSGPSSFLVLGSFGSGKTTLVTLLENGELGRTHTSLRRFTVDATLPSNIIPKSKKYRSEDDFESKRPIKFQLIDTPGHPKLRHFTSNSLRTGTKNLTGIIFVVNAADLTSSSGDGYSTGLRDTAAYLHDVFLQLQKEHTQAKSSKIKELPFLIAANKMDLFTALPEHMVKSSLEAEITRLRSTRSKGIASIGRASKGEGLESGAGDEMQDEDGEVLGGDTEGKFDFSVMDEYSVNVTLAGGSVHGDVGVSKWWDWIANCL